LIPDKVLSASHCICRFFPDAWAIEWTSENVEEKLKKASAFGVSAIDLPTVVTWATESFSTAFGWPNVFYTLKAAQEARERFLPHDSELVIFGLALHRSDVEAFVRAAKPEPACAYRKSHLRPVGTVCGAREIQTPVRFSHRA
jgi:hypothetical protein